MAVIPDPYTGNEKHMPMLTGRTALVTGASRGLGSAIARRLAADGAWVVVHFGRDDDAAARTVAAIRDAGGEAVAVRADLADPAGVVALASAVDGELAGRPLDILVNNAAVFAPTATVRDVTLEEFDHGFAVNVRAPFFLVQHLLPVMADGGRIVNVSSGVTRMATPQLTYSMTKGAIDVLTRSLALMLGEREITVNTVAPGITHTDMNRWLHDNEAGQQAVAAMTALGRVGEPAAIADAVAFLASPDARWVTGASLDVSGGLFLGPAPS